MITFTLLRPPPIKVIQLNLPRCTPPISGRFLGNALQIRPLRIANAFVNNGQDVRYLEVSPYYITRLLSRLTKLIAISCTRTGGGLINYFELMKP